MEFTTALEFTFSSQAYLFAHLTNMDIASMLG